MADYKLHEAGNKRRFKWGEIIFVIVFLIVCAVLLKVLFTQLHLKHEVAAAEQTTDRLINDIAKNNASDARSLGDSGFQKAHSATQLSSLFQTSRGYLHGTPAIDKQTVSNNKNGQGVSVIYKYPNKPVYYIRVNVFKSNGSDKWQLVGISGNSDESKLVIK